MKPSRITGGCYCGKVRYRADGPPKFQGNCHCKNCRGAGRGVDFGLEEIGRVHARATETLPDADEGVANILPGLRDVVDLRNAEAARRYGHHDRQPRPPGAIPAESGFFYGGEVAVGGAGPAPVKSPCREP